MKRNLQELISKFVDTFAPGIGFAGLDIIFDQQLIPHIIEVNGLMSGGLSTLINLRREEAPQRIYEGIDRLMLALDSACQPLSRPACPSNILTHMRNVSGVDPQNPQMALAWLKALKYSEEPGSVHAQEALLVCRAILEDRSYSYAEKVLAASYFLDLGYLKQIRMLANEVAENPHITIGAQNGVRLMEACLGADECDRLALRLANTRDFLPVEQALVLINYRRLRRSESSASVINALQAKIANADKQSLWDQLVEYSPKFAFNAALALNKPFEAIKYFFKASWEMPKSTLGLLALACEHAFNLSRVSSQLARGMILDQEEVCERLLRLLDEGDIFTRMKLFKSVPKERGTLATLDNFLAAKLFESFRR